MSSPPFSNIGTSDQNVCLLDQLPRSLLSFRIVSFADESSGEDEPEATTQEKYEIDWVYSWMEEGGYKPWLKLKLRCC